jgi:hypothetical protein
MEFAASLPYNTVEHVWLGIWFSPGSNSEQPALSHAVV